MFCRGFQLLAWLAWLAVVQIAFAGEPRWVAGSTYFDPSWQRTGCSLEERNGYVLAGYTAGLSVGPDYLYRGRLLYADSVMPSRRALSGAPITIYGTGFHLTPS